MILIITSVLNSSLHTVYTPLVLIGKTYTGNTQVPVSMWSLSFHLTALPCRSCAASAMGTPSGCYGCSNVRSILVLKHLIGFVSYKAAKVTQKFMWMPWSARLFLLLCMFVCGQLVLYRFVLIYTLYIYIMLLSPFTYVHFRWSLLLKRAHPDLLRRSVQQQRMGKLWKYFSK